MDLWQDLAKLCERRTASFETSSRATSVNSGAMKASENAKDECDTISSQTSFFSGTKLNLAKSCEARNGDEGTSSSHVNLERKKCWSVERSDSVGSEFNSRFECVLRQKCDENVGDSRI